MSRSSQRKFGVEFEVSPTFTKLELAEKLKFFEKHQGTGRHVQVEPGVKGWAESICNDYWHVKYDSSCGPTITTTTSSGKEKKTKSSGWEIASFIASGNNDIILISKLAAFLAEQRVESNINCGFHIHVDTGDFTPRQMGILMSRWIALEPILLHALPKHRRNNKYCKPLFKKFSRSLQFVATPEDLWDIISPENFYPHENPEKKVSINSVGYAQKQIQSSHKRPTIELRLPEGLLEEEFVANWMRLFVHFVDTSFVQKEMTPINSCTTVESVLVLLGIWNTNTAFDENLHNLRIWLLKRIVQLGTVKKIVQEAKDKLDFVTNLT